MVGDMYGDFSRLTFVPEKHFSAVLLQQGRVLLDADANEQTAILLHALRLLTADVLGPYAGPPGADANFQISLDTSTPPAKVLRIAGGRYYVHGLLCEADVATSYFEQPDAYLDEELESDSLPDPPYLVYLKVWERLITAAEDPSIRERALGDNGPDTATRSKVVWQVVATSEFPPGSGKQITDWSPASVATAKKQWADWEAALAAAARPTLKAQARQPDASDTDPCIVSPTARYRGIENQLYRVEIHTGGTAANASPAGSATFKWSRDNGAPVFPIESLSGSEVTVTSLGRDAGLGLVVNDWVEVLDDRSVLRGERHALARVSRIEPLDRLVELETAPPEGVGSDPALHPFLRRWDQQEAPSNPGFPTLDRKQGVLEVSETTDGDDQWMELENGVQIQFQKGNHYAAGDYWLIPARTATEDVEWPQAGGGPEARPPVGIDYGYAPLAFVNATGEVKEMRSLIQPVAKAAP